MSAAAGCAAADTDPELPPVFSWSYPVELEDALRALWVGMVGASSTAESTAGASP
jgi:hypothetical protein